MDKPYPGPLRDEPLAIELHNTLYAVGRKTVDGLADESAANAWLDALAHRLPTAGLPSGPWPSVDELVKLRGAVRAALHAAIEASDQDAAVLEAVNVASARAPSAPTALWRPNGPPEFGETFLSATRADVVVGAFASNAIKLLTGPRREDLRACGAPGCVLLYLKDHPRRAWCSNTCGNRARQARHYDRARRLTGA
jgi:predicted RNA-binding Zn ribbon-like protein